MYNNKKNILSRSKVRWNFFNSGTRYTFDPEKLAQTITNVRTTLKEIHIDLVRNANRPDVYLLNELGELVL